MPLNEDHRTDHAEAIHEQNYGYKIAVYLCVAALIAMLAALMFYVLCSKRFKLNWYERSQLSALSEASKTLFGDDEDQEAVETRKSGLFLHKSRSDSVMQTGQQQEYFYRKIGFGKNGHKGVTRKMECEPERSSTEEKLSSCLKSSMSKEAQSAHPFFLYQENVGVTKYVQPGATAPDKPEDILTAGSEQVSASTPRRTSRPRLTSMHSKLDHTKIDAAMYDSKEDCQNQSFGDELRGSLNFSISYDTNLQLITVCLKQACDLVPRQFSGTADPYAKVRILPDVKASRKSCVHKNTTNPQFNEDFIFDVPQSDLLSRIVQIIIYDFDEYSRHEYMGSMELPLEHIDLSEKVTLWKGLTIVDHPTTEVEKGELMLSLCYLPSAQRLTIVIMKIRNLSTGIASPSGSGNIDSKQPQPSKDWFVKVSINQPSKKLKKKKRTSVQKGVSDVIFNEAINFDITKDVLETMNLEVTVVNDNILGQNEVVGRVVIGQSSIVESAQEHYQQLLSGKGTAIAMWHPLSIRS